MKIALAQIQSHIGEVEKNIEKHKLWSQKAADLGAKAIFFPELSLTAYEPSLAKTLTRSIEDPVFAPLQKVSDDNEITIGAGMPAAYLNSLAISMYIFQPGIKPLAYHKQFLHEDESLFFIPGNRQMYILEGDQKIAPAICYESILPEHIEAAVQDGCTMYLASVARDQKSIPFAMEYYAKASIQYQTPVLVVNAIGPGDHFISAGQSAVWNGQGELIGQLDPGKEAILLIDFTINTAVQIGDF